MRQYLEEALKDLKNESIIELEEAKKKEKEPELKVEYENAEKKDPLIKELVDLYDDQLNEELLEEDIEKFKMTQDQYDRMMKEFSIADDTVVFVTDSGFVGFKRFPFGKVKLASNQNRVLSVAKNTTLEEINNKLEKIEKKLNMDDLLGRAKEAIAASKSGRRTDVLTGEERIVPVEIWEERLEQALADPDGKERQTNEHRAVYGIRIKDGYETPVCENGQAAAQFVGDPDFKKTSNLIYKCCDGKDSSYLGFYWTYADPQRIKEKIAQAKAEQEA